MLHQTVVIGLFRQLCFSVDDSWQKRVMIQFSLLITLCSLVIPLWASPSPLKRVSKIELGSLHSCALTQSGQVKCWGGGTAESKMARNVMGLEDKVKDIAGGSFHTCALLETGNLKCWGDNSSSQLGDGTNIKNSLIPVGVVGLEKSLMVVAGDYHTCSLSEMGNVKCWGNNPSGQLGNGTDPSSNFPKEVIELGNKVVSLTGGGAHTCALLKPGEVKCWGNNYYGQLGNGTTHNSYLPMKVVDLNEATMVIAGDYHTCALVKTGRVKCWGANNVGQLGNGTTKSSSFPTEVVGLSEITSLAGGGSHTCALSKTESMKCWGNNKSGQLGNGTKENSSIPVEVIGLDDQVIAIGTGDLHTCALLKKENKVKCWGNNTNGQVGDNSTTDSSKPVEVLCEDCPLSHEKKIYCLDDQGLNDSQLCVGSLFPTPSLTSLGPVYQNCDLESLDASPVTGDIFAAAGDNTPRPGHLYYVNKEDGDLVDLGNIGGKGFLEEIDALSFHPQTNELWGWAQGEGLFVIEKLPSWSNSEPTFPEVNIHHPLCEKPSLPVICRNTSSPQCSRLSGAFPVIQAVLVLPVETVEVEDITWNWRGDTLYAIENIHQGHDLDGQGARDSQGNLKLWAYNGKEVVSICPNLSSLLETQVGQRVEIEGMEALPPELFPTANPTSEDVLLMSFHNLKKMFYMGIIIPSAPLTSDTRCFLWEWDEGTTLPFSDIEGITYLDE